MRDEFEYADQSEMSALAQARKINVVIFYNEGESPPVAYLFGKSEDPCYLLAYQQVHQDHMIDEQLEMMVNPKMSDEEVEELRASIAENVAAMMGGMDTSGHYQALIKHDRSGLYSLGEVCRLFANLKICQ